MGFIKNIFTRFHENQTFVNKGKIIRNQVRKNNSIIYGAQALKKQIGPFARQTRDYDILSKNPRRSARQLERKLDKKSGGDFYFTRQSLFHPSTHKVIHKGKDMKKNTRDDIGIADFSPMRKVKTKRIGGVRYVKPSEVAKDKRRALKQKQFAFRHQKDRDDLNRIKAYRALRRF